MSLRVGTSDNLPSAARASLTPRESEGSEGLCSRLPHELLRPLPEPSESASRPGSSRAQKLGLHEKEGLSSCSGPHKLDEAPRISGMSEEREEIRQDYKQERIPQDCNKEGIRQDYHEVSRGVGQGFNGGQGDIKGRESEPLLEIQSKLSEDASSGGLFGRAELELVDARRVEDLEDRESEPLLEIHSKSSEGASSGGVPGEAEGKLVDARRVASEGHDAGGGDTGVGVELQQHPEESSLLTGECRICQEEDAVKNLDTPCSCTGTLKFAHEACVQHWCDEKGNTTCEICHQPYKSTYVAAAPGPAEQSAGNVLSIEIREESGPDGTPSRVLTLRDTVTGEETRFDLSEPEEPQDPWASCKSVCLIAFLLIFLPRAFILLFGSDGEVGDAPNDPVAAMLRVVGIAIPLIVLFRVVHIVNERRRELEEAESEATEAAAQVAFLVHARHAQLAARNNTDDDVRVEVVSRGRLPWLSTTMNAAPPVAQSIV